MAEALPHLGGSTWAVPGFLFGVEDSATRRSTRDGLARLEGLATFPLEQRPRGAV